MIKAMDFTVSRMQRLSLEQSRIQLYQVPKSKIFEKEDKDKVKNVLNLFKSINHRNKETIIRNIQNSITQFIRKNQNNNDLDLITIIKNLKELNLSNLNSKEDYQKYYNTLENINKELKNKICPKIINNDKIISNDFEKIMKIAELFDKIIMGNILEEMIEIIIEQTKIEYQIVEGLIKAFLEFQNSLISYKYAEENLELEIYPLNEYPLNQKIKKNHNINNINLKEMNPKKSKNDIKGLNFLLAIRTMKLYFEGQKITKNLDIQELQNIVSEYSTNSLEAKNLEALKNKLKKQLESETDEIIRDTINLDIAIAESRICMKPKENNIMQFLEIENLYNEISKVEKILKKIAECEKCFKNCSEAMKQYNEKQSIEQIDQNIQNGENTLEKIKILHNKYKEEVLHQLPILSLSLEDNLHITENTELKKIIKILILQIREVDRFKINDYGVGFSEKLIENFTLANNIFQKIKNQNKTKEYQNFMSQIDDFLYLIKNFILINNSRNIIETLYKSLLQERNKSTDFQVMEFFNTNYQKFIKEDINKIFQNQENFLKLKHELNTLFKEGQKNKMLTQRCLDDSREVIDLLLQQENKNYTKSIALRTDLLETKAKMDAMQLSTQGINENIKARIRTFETTSIVKFDFNGLILKCTNLSKQIINNQNKINKDKKTHEIDKINIDQEIREIFASIKNFEEFLDNNKSCVNDNNTIPSNVKQEYQKEYKENVDSIQRYKNALNLYSKNF